MRGNILRPNASIAACVRAGDPHGALLQFQRMHRHGFPLDGFSFTPAFSACSAMPAAPGLLAGRQLHALALKFGTLFAAITRTALLCAYDKCSCQSPKDALSLFDEMPSRDVISWNALISCLVRHGRAAGALTAFRRMVFEDNLRATAFTLASLLKACGMLRSPRRGRQIHAAIVVAGSFDSVVLGTALMDFYSDCGLLDCAFTVFDLHLLCGNDQAACNALIAGCVKNGRHREAFSLLREIDLSAAALTAAISACSDSSNLRYGREIHCAAVRRALACYSTAFCNALSDMYARLGKIEHARHLFDETPAKDVLSWTSLIRAYGSHGRAGEALKLFKEMEGAASPNSATFLSVISACAHAGLVDEGRECFLSMKARHGVDPGSEHIACFIDLLGRAGRMEEAWETFSAVSDPDLGICIAMLNACAANADTERGIIMAERIPAMAAEESSRAGAYVAVSNFYAGAGIWEKAEETRRLMEGKRLRKELGCSIQIGTQ